MKTLTYLLSLFFLTVYANHSLAQSPGSFTYQAVIRDNTGTPITETEIAIRISLLQGTSSGTVSYMETHSIHTNKYGLVNLSIGDGTVISGNINDINWATGPYFIKVEIDLSGGSNYTEISTSQILSVPYALYAKTAGNFDYENLTNKPTIPVINDNNVSEDSLWSSSKTKATIDALILRIERLESLVLDTLKEVWLTDSTGKTYDIEGNEYNFKKIGNQIWMTENLKTTKYSNGDDIGTTNPFNLNISQESNLSYQWVYGGDSANLTPYGRLYTWYAVNDPRNVCPIGWHVPGDNEMTILEDFLGGNYVAGGKLKEAGNNHWLDPNTGATNSSGFTAVPGGYRSHAGGNTISGIQTIGSYAFYWTVTSNDIQYAISRRIMFDDMASNVHITEKYDGVSVRCLKDEQ
jgi:uncharacterized protein (TIGR02145 family)